MKNPKKTTSIETLGPKTSIENKLSLASLQLHYAFDYGIDFQNRIIKITGPIEPPQFDLFDAAITQMESSSRKTITVKINSYGGETYEALAILGRMRQSNCKIVTEAFGKVMSAATIILAGGDRRRFSKYATFMHHESSYGIEDSHSRIKSIVEQMEREELLWAETMAKFSKKPAKFWLEIGVHLDEFFNAEQLLKTGLIDEIF
jgi:ATP-dependent protease ClpP protease subunit